MNKICTFRILKERILVKIQYTNTQISIDHIFTQNRTFCLRSDISFLCQWYGVTPSLAGFQLFLITNRWIKADKLVLQLYTDELKKTSWSYNYKHK